jgi:hypothetical protein
MIVFHIVVIGCDIRLLISPAKAASVKMGKPELSAVKMGKPF